MERGSVISNLEDLQDNMEPVPIIPLRDIDCYKQTLIVTTTPSSSIRGYHVLSWLPLTLRTSTILEQKLSRSIKEPRETARNTTTQSKQGKSMRLWKAERQGRVCKQT